MTPSRRSAPTLEHPALRLWADTLAATRPTAGESATLRAETQVRLFAHAMDATGYALVRVRDPLRPIPAPAHRRREDSDLSPLLGEDATRAATNAAADAWSRGTPAGQHFGDEVREWLAAFLHEQDRDALTGIVAAILTDAPSRPVGRVRQRLTTRDLARAVVDALLGAGESDITLATRERGDA